MVPSIYQLAVNKTLLMNKKSQINLRFKKKKKEKKWEQHK